MSDLLAAALSATPTGQVVTATCTAVRVSERLVDVDFGSGAVVERVPVLVSWTDPRPGVQVQVLRRDPSSWLVLGPLQTAFSSSVTQTTRLDAPHNVYPALPGGGVANPFVVAAVATSSWRKARAGSSYGWERSDVYQGASPDAVAYGYWRGLYFYGANPVAALAGRRAVSGTIRVARKGAGGQSAATRQVIGPHMHPTIPTDGTVAPLFPYGAQTLGSLAWSATGELAVPVSWLQMLIDGQVAGFGHLLMAAGNGSYSIAQSLTTDPLSGRLTIVWE